MVKRIKWAPVIEAGALIVNSYNTPVTLRQLFYRLVSAGLLPNAENPYNRLGRLTAEARRNGTFPELADRTRTIERPLSFDSPADAIKVVEAQYRVDRTKGQEHQVWVVLEKSTLSSQVAAWLDEYGVPIVALRGYTSTPLIASINRQVDADGRKAVGLYLGDLDPSGVNIQEVLEKYTWFDSMERLAVLPAQISSLGLTPFSGKPADPRAESFVSRYGSLFQVEVEAIDPAVLQGLVTNAVEAITDREALEAAQDLEAEHKARLVEIAEDLEEE